MDYSPDAPQWPHNGMGDDDIVIVLDEPLAKAGYEEMHAAPDLSDVPRTKNGLLDASVVPPLAKSHLPDLTDDLQARSEKDTPGGYAGLDANGKLSPYVLPTLAQGMKGDTGGPGSKGDQGDQGVQGRDGRVGDPGPPGREGAEGKQGPPGPRGLAADTSDLLRIPADPPTLFLNSDTLARDLAYRMAELGLIRLA